MKEQIIQILKEKHKKSGGNCGIYLPEISRELITDDYSNFKKVIDELCAERKITVHPGVQGELVFLVIPK